MIYTNNNLGGDIQQVGSFIRFIRLFKLFQGIFLGKSKDI